MNFENTYANLPSDFYQKLIPQGGLKPDILFFNEKLANELSLEFSHIPRDVLANYFSFNTLIPNSSPLAMAYAGHQFGHFVPELGDGRAVLLGEVVAPNKMRYDIHLKGAGQTKFSRRGDGKSALGPSIRECLISEAMHYLGIPTTRTLCVVRTSEMVLRDQLLPAGISTRIALSHIRIGTFEYFAAKDDSINLKILTDYAISRLYPELKDAHHQYFNFWKQVFLKQIKLITKWMSIGFIHGVMNTDNMNISGETIDYGPCAFMDEFSHLRVFSSIDHHGRYAYGNQPKMMFWNMIRFAECLTSLFEVSHQEIQEEINKMQKIFLDEYNKQMLLKLGIANYQEGDEELIRQWLGFLEKNNLDFTLSHLDVERFLLGKQLYLNLTQFEDFEKIIKIIKQRDTNENLVKFMLQKNPMLIPRNHLVEEAIQGSIAGDDEKFFNLLKNLSNPYERVDELNDYHKPAKNSQRVYKTFCGT